jgi:hypothetical protein
MSAKPANFEMSARVPRSKNGLTLSPTNRESKRIGRLGSDMSAHAVYLPKNFEKCLAMPTRIVTRNVILRALGGYMRKFKRFPRRRLPFRSLLILAGALMLLAAFAPRAHADLIAYFNFEGPATPPYPVNLASQVPPGFATTTLILTDEAGNPYPSGNTLVAPGIPFNVAPGDPDPNLTAMGFNRTAQHDLNVDIPLISAQGIYDVTSVSFAYGANGNGWEFVQLQFSTNNGITFTNIGGLVALPATPGSFINISVPLGTTINVSNLVMRLTFSGGQSNGNDLQFELDNIQINGIIVPEPATIAGGLLGVLGLCWFQRRRLIHAVRFRRT